MHLLMMANDESATEKGPVEPSMKGSPVHLCSCVSAHLPTDFKAGPARAGSLPRGLRSWLACLYWRWILV